MTENKERLYGTETEAVPASDFPTWTEFQLRNWFSKVRPGEFVNTIQKFGNSESFCYFFNYVPKSGDLVEATLKVSNLPA